MTDYFEIQGKVRLQPKQDSQEEQERSKKQKKTERSERHKVTYDMPEEISEMIKTIAEQEGISASATAALLLADGLHRYQKGQVLLDEAKRTSPSPRWEYAVDDEQTLTVLDLGLETSD